MKERIHRQWNERRDTMSQAQDREVLLITGSNGFVGRHIAERLGENYAIVGFDRDEMGKSPSLADYHSVDFASEDSVRNGLRQLKARHGDRLASVIHLAAYYSFSGEPSPLYDEVTVQGTRRLVEGLQEFEVGQLIFSSTMLVHAPCEPGERITEDSPLLPKWDYPRSKLETEQLLREARWEFPIALLRISVVYDEGCHAVPFSRQIQRIYEGRLTARVFPGDATHGNSAVHVRDLTAAVERLIERRGELPPETTLLLAEPEVLSYDDLQRTFSRLLYGEECNTMRIPKGVAKAGSSMQNSLPRLPTPPLLDSVLERAQEALNDSPLRESVKRTAGSVADQIRGRQEEFIKPWLIDIADDHYALDASRARHLLGWEPAHSLRATVPAMIRGLIADPEGWYRENKLDSDG
jgi:nucleoside-diphosphate-sugar epimerase